MANYFEPEHIAGVFNLPIDVIEDVLKGNISGSDEKQSLEERKVKVIERARFVRNKTICAISPGGGKGKTSVLTSIAMLAALHNPGGRLVSAIDLAEFSNMQIHFGIHLSDQVMMPDITHCSDEIDRTEIFEHISIKHPLIENLYLIPGAQTVDRHRNINKDNALSLLRNTQRYFEMIFIDLPARLDLQEDIISDSDTVLIIANNDYQSIEGIVKLMPMLFRLGKENQSLLVVNESYNPGIKPGSFQHILARLLEMEMPATAWLPYEKSLPAWLNRTESKHPVLDISTDYKTELLKLLSKLCPDWNLDVNKQSKGGVWGWLKK